MKRLVPVVAAVVVLVACGDDASVPATTVPATTAAPATTAGPTSTGAGPVTTVATTTIPAFASIDQFIAEWNRVSSTQTTEGKQNPATLALAAGTAILTPQADGTESVAWRLNDGVAVGGTRTGDGSFVSSGLFVDPDNELAAAVIATYLLVHAASYDPSTVLQAYFTVSQATDPTTVADAVVGNLDVKIRNAGADVVNDPVLAITAIVAGSPAVRDAAHQAALTNLLAAFA